MSADRPPTGPILRESRFKPKSALVKDFRRDALFLAQDSQQQMLGSDMPMIQPFCFFGGIGENAFALVRKRQIDGRRNFLTNGRPAFNFLADTLDRGMIPKKTIRQILIFTN